MTILYINNNLLVKVKYLFNFNIKIISRILKKNSIDRAWKSKQREASFDPFQFIETVFCDRSTVSIICACRANSRQMRVRRERRRRNEEGAWHTHDTLVATHRALCTGIRHKADERDPPSVERVSETRCTRLDTEENGWKSRADLRQLLVRKVQYVYNNHYFITIFWYTKMLFNNWEFTRRAISFLGINKNKTNLHAKNSKNKRRVFLF